MGIGEIEAKPHEASICSANEGQVRGIRNILLVCIVLVGFIQ